MLHQFAAALSHLSNFLACDNEDTPAMLQLLDTRINLFSRGPGRQTLSPLIFGRDET